MPWIMPQHTWVVTQVKVTTVAGKPDPAAAPVSQCTSSTPSCTQTVTDYRYAEPRFGSVPTQKGDVPRPASFLGFGRVRSIGTVGYYLAYGIGLRYRIRVWQRRALRVMSE